MQNETVPHETNGLHAIAELYEHSEKLRDPATRRDHFASLEPEDFLDLVQQVNALIRTGDAQHLHPFDGTHAGLSTHEVPDQRDKEQLLRETWEAARDILQDSKLDSEEALMYAGLATAGGMLLVHPYIDGNGRTSRVLSHMIMRGPGEDTTSEVAQLLSEKGRSEWDVEPRPNLTRVYAEYPYERSSELPAKLSWPESEDQEIGVVTSPEDAASKIAEARFKERALHLFMLHTDDAAREIVRQYTKYDEAGEPIQLDVESALRALVNMPNHGIGYAAQLTEAERWSRADYVRRYLRSMQEKIPREPEGNLAKRVALMAEWADEDPGAAAQVEAFRKLAVGKFITPRAHARVNHASSKILVRSKNK